MCWLGLTQFDLACTAGQGFAFPLQYGYLLEVVSFSDDALVFETHRLGQVCPYLDYSNVLACSQVCGTMMYHMSNLQCGHLRAQIQILSVMPSPV